MLVWDAVKSERCLDIAELAYLLTVWFAEQILTYSTVYAIRNIILA